MIVAPEVVVPRVVVLGVVVPGIVVLDLKHQLQSADSYHNKRKSVEILTFCSWLRLLYVFVINLLANHWKLTFFNFCSYQ